MRTKTTVSKKRLWVSLVLGVVLTAGVAAAAEKAPKVFVLGVDGLDPKLLDQVGPIAEVPFV